MIHRVTSTILDKERLSLRSIESSPVTIDFSKMVVNKPWGYEYLLTRTPLVEVWHLSLDHNKSTSMHCHPNKKTALLILEGKALFSTLKGSIKLKAHDTVTIDSGVFHSTQSLSKKGLKLLEIETPPMKHDLIRLEDKYGRANTGYEGLDKMKVVNGSYARFNKNGIGLIKNFCNSDIGISVLDDMEIMKKELPKNTHTAVIINGFIKSHAGDILYSVGDAVPINELWAGTYAFKNISLLSVKKNTS